MTAREGETSGGWQIVTRGRSMPICIDFNAGMKTSGKGWAGSLTCRSMRFRIETEIRRRWLVPDDALGHRRHQQKCWKHRSREVAMLEAGEGNRKHVDARRCASISMTGWRILGGWITTIATCKEVKGTSRDDESSSVSRFGPLCEAGQIVVIRTGYGPRSCIGFHGTLQNMFPWGGQ